jgi:hypothetical protein
MNDAKTSALRAWLDAAWDRHDRAPGEVLAGLRERAPTLPDDDDGAEALALAEHVALGHLGDAEGLAALLPLLPPHAGLDSGRERAAWALAAIDGRTHEAPLALRCRALDGAVLALAHRGQVAQARALLLAPEAEALASDDAAVRRAFAASANNVAGGLRGAAREQARDALMLEAAALARRAWERAGSWLHVERADWQLAMCHASAGDAAGAIRHGKSCLARCVAEGADAYERFFAHQCLAEAYGCSGDAAAVAAQRDQMVALLAEVQDPALRAYCESTLAGTPPLGG